jgi:hypothetical protein
MDNRSENYRHRKNAMKTKIAIAVAGIVMSMNVSSALACGESLFHNGQGMRYHAFITRQPADILFYRPSSSGSTDSSKQLFAGLEKAGHHVTILIEESGVMNALMTHHYDVVIASAHDMDAISAHLDKSKSEPALLAVVGSDQDSQRERFTHSVRASDGVNQYLKSIEQSMRTRGS